MKFFFEFVLIVAVIAYVSAQPLDHEVNEKGNQTVLSRVRRATCDLLSVDTPFGSLHDSACAGHCLLQGYKGGRCINGVCNCRN